MRCAFFALAVVACCSFVSTAGAMDLGALSGGALFSGTTGIQTYYAQVSDGKNPLLKTYVFLAGEHFYALLRQTSSSSGSIEYQAYANGGATKKGSGSYTISGNTLKAKASKGFRLDVKVTGSRIQIQYTGIGGGFRTAGALRRF